MKRLLGEINEPVQDSVAITDPQIIETYVSNPNNPFLISFPRTGSHWLRMIMELYFKRPSLTRAFYYPNEHNYLTLHTHDLELGVERLNVIYLYRDPVDTIYSQMNYYKEDLRDLAHIEYWSELYGRHLAKWLHQETFTDKKTILRYELLKSNTQGEFVKICAHFGAKFDKNLLNSVMATVSKNKVKEKTLHDPQVVNFSRSYEENRQAFRSQYSDQIWRFLLQRRKFLEKYFNL